MLNDFSRQTVLKTIRTCADRRDFSTINRIISTHEFTYLITSDFMATMFNALARTMINNHNLVNRRGAPNRAVISTGGDLSEIIDAVVAINSPHIVTSALHQKRCKLMVTAMVAGRTDIVEQLIEHALTSPNQIRLTMGSGGTSCPVDIAVSTGQMELFNFCFDRLGYTAGYIIENPSVISGIVGIPDGEVFLDFALKLASLLNTHIASAEAVVDGTLASVFAGIISNTSSNDRITTLINIFKFKAYMFSSTQCVDILYRGLTCFINKDSELSEWCVINAMIRDMEFDKDDVVTCNNKVIRRLFRDGNWLAIEYLCQTFGLTADDVPPGAGILRRSLKHGGDPVDTLKHAVEYFDITPAYVRSESNLLHKTCSANIFDPLQYFNLMIKEYGFFTRADFLAKGSAMLKRLIKHSRINSIKALLKLSVLEPSDFIKEGEDEKRAFIYKLITNKDRGSNDLVDAIMAGLLGDDGGSRPPKSFAQYYHTDHLNKSRWFEASMLNLEPALLVQMIRFLEVDVKTIGSDFVTGLMATARTDDEYSNLCKNLKTLNKTYGFECFTLRHLLGTIRTYKLVELHRFMIDRFIALGSSSSSQSSSSSEDDRRPLPIILLRGPGKFKSLVMKKAIEANNIYIINYLVGTLTASDVPCLYDAVRGKPVIEYITASDKPEVRHKVLDFLLKSGYVDKPYVKKMVTKFGGVPKTCTICFDDVEPSNILVGGICGHAVMCVDCFAQVCQHTQEDGTINHKCPICKQRNVYVPVAEVLR